MFPIRDINPPRTAPWVTWSLIGLNLATWLVIWAGGTEVVHAAQQAFGVIPVRLLRADSWWVLATPFTSSLIHASWLHVGANMWFLHVFGDNVEDHLGKGRFALFYVLCGLAAVGAHVLLDLDGQVPLVGASGAVAGVLGAYMMRFPRAPVQTWVVFAVVEVPALTFLFVWFAVQLAMMLYFAVTMTQGGVAFAAHIGGFAVGVVLERLMAPPPKPKSPRPSLQ